MAYQQMAAVYDHLMNDAPYDNWVHFTEHVIKKSGKNVKSVVDLGCGTGQITTRLARNGYSMTGVDYSSEMLSYAEQRASEEKLPIQWIHQDIRTLQGIRDKDLAVSYCDVINYVTEDSELLATFKNIADTLKPGGLFLFDVHSLYHVRSNFINHTFTETGDDIAYIWECTEGENEGEMYHDLTFFVRDEEHYIRFDEYHHQRTFSIDFYQRLLNQTGFRVMHVTGDFSLDDESLYENTERVFIVAEKRLEK
ncbi:class I SAM-dependent DNA methyltransferase [Virgibacillus kekensis]|uniref:Class I SAM-dependent DNA methyltransferase n=1 Tax=Virgibacillus kekensis TaxID=202261 RepID=A0ABV9DKN4_9BACI